MRCSLLLKTISIAFMVSCGNHNKKEEEKMTEEKMFQEGSFGYDLQFLKEKDENLIVLEDNTSTVIVSPKYQAKVFTSSAEGATGKSFGWINYEAFSAEKDSHMNAYGGENRFWLGPEGSKYSLFFKPKEEMVYENWVTPAGVDTESWQVQNKSAREVSMTKAMKLDNYAGTELNLQAERSVKILSPAAINSLLSIETDSLKVVGFTTVNSISNTGERAWTQETGAPCIWMLDMFTPSPETVIILPYEEQSEGKIATTDYFGEIPKERIRMENGTILFKADGKNRGKLGVPPNRARNKSGSYDPKSNTLTITLYNLDKNAIYLNQEWTDTKDPYQGDAVNAYNDGPLEDGSQMGPFYEIESVSPVAFLKPNETLTHEHSVFHFTGNKAYLNKICKQLLNISLEEVQQAFK